MLPLTTLAEIPRDKKWSVLSLAHPNAKMLIGVDWQKAIASPLAPVLVKQVHLGGHPLLTFLESIDGVERLLVSSPGEKAGRKPLLVVADGRFLLSKIRASAVSDGAVTRRYNGVEMLVPPDATNDDLHFALLDGNTILFGDGLSVKGAIDRWQRPGNWYGRNPLFPRAEALSAAQDIWAAVEDPAMSLASLGLQGTALAEDVEQIDLGIRTGETMEAQLTIRAVNEESIQTLAGGLPALLQMAALTYADQPYLSQVAKRLKVTRDRQYLRMGVALEAKLLDQSLAELRHSGTPQTLAAGPPVQTPMPSQAVAAIAQKPVPAPVSLAAAPRRVIKIIGAEGGDREIPYEATGRAQ